MKPTRYEDIDDPYASVPLPKGVETEQMGVWRVLMRRSPAWSSPLGGTLVAAPKATPRDTLRCKLYSAFRLFRDIYGLGPAHATVVLFGFISTGVWESLSWWMSHRLLVLLEKRFENNELVDAQELLLALLSSLGCTAIHMLYMHFRGRMESILSRRVSLHFEERWLNNRLSMDIATHEQPDVAIGDKGQGGRAWGACTGLLSAVTRVSSTTSRLMLVSMYTASKKDLTIAVFSAVVWPIIYSACIFRWDDHTYFTYLTHAPYRRMQAVRTSIQQHTLRTIVGHDLADYFMQEWRKARTSMGDISGAKPWDLDPHMSDSLLGIAIRLMCDLPVILYTAQCVLNNAGSLSLTSLRALQELSSSLGLALADVASQRENLTFHLGVAHQLYEAIDPQESAHYSEVPYITQPDVGMGIRVLDASLQYTAGDKTRFALKNVSFTVAPSSLVVIVGENGSGKSSLVNLLAGLLRPTSGDILVDGSPSDRYRRADLRAATALLTQETTIFRRFSLAENIGIGDPVAVNDRTRIEKAAKAGGSWAFIEKLSRGDTMLDPASESILRPGPDATSTAFFEDLQKRLPQVSDISGGECQRLAASRAFMRLDSGNIKLALFDEPTSAMDPKSEQSFFDELLKARAGKTMVVVTHRFKHLVSHADMILCMKDGRLVESGTHEKLMKKKGEYCALFNAQAITPVGDKATDNDRTKGEDASADEPTRTEGRSPAKQDLGGDYTKPKVLDDSRSYSDVALALRHRQPRRVSTS